MATIVKMNSEAWSIHKDVTVYDPDGWDRKNFAESWAEVITEEEFDKRVFSSTIIPGKNFRKEPTEV